MVDHDHDGGVGSMAEVGEDCRAISLNQRYEQSLHTNGLSTKTPVKDTGWAERTIRAAGMSFSSSTETTVVSAGPSYVSIFLARSPRTI